jgi:hypothetical protein
MCSFNVLLFYNLVENIGESIEIIQKEILVS